MEATITSIGNKEKRDKIVHLVSGLLKQKNDNKGSEQLESRWLASE